MLLYLVYDVKYHDQTDVRTLITIVDDFGKAKRAAIDEQSLIDEADCNIVTGHYDLVATYDRNGCSS
jgi:hypothetical protein